MPDIQFDFDVNRIKRLTEQSSQAFNAYYHKALELLDELRNITNISDLSASANDINKIIERVHSLRNTDKNIALADCLLHESISLLDAWKDLNEKLIFFKAKFIRKTQDKILYCRSQTRDCLRVLYNNQKIADFFHIDARTNNIVLEEKKCERQAPEIFAEIAPFTRLYKNITAEIKTYNETCETIDPHKEISFTPSTIESEFSRINWKIAEYTLRVSLWEKKIAQEGPTLSELHKKEPAQSKKFLDDYNLQLSQLKTKVAGLHDKIKDAKKNLTQLSIALLQDPAVWGLFQVGETGSLSLKPDAKGHPRIQEFSNDSANLNREIARYEETLGTRLTAEMKPLIKTRSQDQLLAILAIYNHKIDHFGDDDEFVPSSIFTYKTNVINELISLYKGPLFAKNPHIPNQLILLQSQLNNIRHEQASWKKHFGTLKNNLMQVTYLNKFGLNKEKRPVTKKLADINPALFKLGT